MMLNVQHVVHAYKLKYDTLQDTIENEYVHSSKRVRNFLRITSGKT